MLRNIFFLLLLVFVISQFLRPQKNEGSYDSITAFETKAMVTDDVRQVLEKKCYDCHSNTTRYPWYMEVSPITHWMAYQIEEGREHFNVSEWDSYDEERKKHKLEEIVEEIEMKEMPLKPYTWIHGELNSGEAERLINWAKELKQNGFVKKEDTLQIEVRDTVPVLDSITGSMN